MIENEKASLSIRKIAFITILFILILGASTIGANIQFSNVKIILSNNYEMNVLTTKTKVEEILKENHIVVLPEEITVPNLEADLNENKVITITKALEEENSLVKLAEENSEISIEQLLGNYTPVVEKIITEQVEIQYETVTEDGNNAEESKSNKIITNGESGLKEITYKGKFRNDVEIERILLSETTIKEPVNKVVQVKKIATSRSGVERKTTVNPEATSSNELAKKVSGKTPQVKNFNTSAYCSCYQCCGKTTGTTSSGAKASSWYTLAAGKGYPIGTVIYIPYFKDKPNGGWFVVQDRGGSISNNKIDIYMGTHSQAIQFGRKTLECYVYM